MKVYYYFLALFICTFFAQAQEKTFMIDQQKSIYHLSSHLHFLADSTEKLSIEQVKNKTFLPVTTIQNTKINGVYWYKIIINNRQSYITNFVLSSSVFKVAELYLFDQKNELITSQVFQDTLHQEPFSLQVGHKKVVTVFVKAIANQTIHTSQLLNLVPAPHFYEQIIQLVAHRFVFQGAMWIMFFYNLLFLLIVRDRAYGYYSLYIMSMALVSIDTYIIPNLTLIYLDWITSLASLAVTLFYSQFIRYFLNIPTIRPTINRYCDYWVYARLAMTFFAIIFYSKNIADILQNQNNVILFAFMIDILLGLYFIYIAWRNNRLLATYVVLGYLAMTFPLAVAILKQILFESADPDTDGTMVQIGVLIELILFSLGLGYRSKVTEQEKLQAVEENRQIIAQQNTVLEQKVTERTLEIQHQKEAIEKQNLGIRQNINYARRIQAAFLPKEETIRQYIDEFFVFFRPRDVVSGDFYFVEEVQGKVVVAAIDCTGHGVSGAFMTMLGNEILRNLVDNQFITSPDILLNELHKGVRIALKQQETDNKDGMDLSVITIDKTKNTVEFAGAKNPAIYIQNGELFVLKADKMPIGGEQREQERIFNKTTIDISEPTTFYLFSDGYQDQFGGENDKKFMLATMKKMFLEIANLPMAKQQQIITTTFEQWKEGREQTDDVLVMGLKI
jgi:serine phosphatase RsbU (regulator of sigma subunit)